MRGLPLTVRELRRVRSFLPVLPQDSREQEKFWQTTQMGRFRPSRCLPTHRPQSCWRDESVCLNPTDSVESGAGFDQIHAGIGEAEMVTYLVDQRVADDAVKVVAVPEAVLVGYL